jgi:hypothetical protein
MKVSMIALATALALSSTDAMAESGSSADGMAVNPAARSAINGMHRKHHQYYVQNVQRVQPAATNCLGLNSLGVSTN